MSYFNSLFAVLIFKGEQSSAEIDAFEYMTLIKKTPYYFLVNLNDTEPPNSCRLAPDIT